VFTPFNEPLHLEYRLKSSLLSWLNHIPFKDSLCGFLMAKFPRLSRHFIQEEVVIIPRIVEHPWVFRNLELSHGKILDVGCCESKLPIELASLGYEVYGIDIRNYRFTHPNFQFIKADITRMPFKNDSFDYVISISTLQNIGFGVYKDPIITAGDVKAILEMRRLLKSDGTMLISVPYGGKPYSKKSKWRNKCIWYNKNSLQKLLRNFRIEKREYFLKRGGSWVPCSEKDTEDVDPSLGNVCLKLRKV